MTWRYCVCIHPVCAMRSCVLSAKKGVCVFGCWQFFNFSDQLQAAVFFSHLTFLVLFTTVYLVFSSAIPKQTQAYIHNIDPKLRNFGHSIHISLSVVVVVVVYAQSVDLFKNHFFFPLFCLPMHCLSQFPFHLTKTPKKRQQQQI